MTNVAVLVNPSNRILSEAFLRALQPVANTLGFQLDVLEANTQPDIDKTFAAISQIRADSLVIMPDVFFSARGEELARLTVSHAVPAVYAYRAFVSGGGLLSYGADEVDDYRMVGNYAGKRLKGEKPRIACTTVDKSAVDDRPQYSQDTRHNRAGRTERAR